MLLIIACPFCRFVGRHFADYYIVVPICNLKELHIGLLMGIDGDLREIKKTHDFVKAREEILTMIWDMEEEIMGKDI